MKTKKDKNIQQWWCEVTKIINSDIEKNENEDYYINSLFTIFFFSSYYQSLWLLSGFNHLTLKLTLWLFLFLWISSKSSSILQRNSLNELQKFVGCTSRKDSHQSFCSWKASGGRRRCRQAGRQQWPCQSVVFIGIDSVGIITQVFCRHLLLCQCICLLCFDAHIVVCFDTYIRTKNPNNKKTYKTTITTNTYKLVTLTTNTDLPSG